MKSARWKRWKGAAGSSEAMETHRYSRMTNCIAYIDIDDYVDLQCRQNVVVDHDTTVLVSPISIAVCPMSSTQHSLDIQPTTPPLVSQSGCNILSLSTLTVTSLWNGYCNILKSEWLGKSGCSWVHLGSNLQLYRWDEYPLRKRLNWFRFIVLQCMFLEH